MLDDELKLDIDKHYRSKRQAVKQKDRCNAQAMCLACEAGPIFGRQVLQHKRSRNEISSFDFSRN